MNQNVTIRHNHDKVLAPIYLLIILHDKEVMHKHFWTDIILIILV
jgi:hypothetical protein